MALKTEHSFNPTTYRHFINGQEFVLHCHHYMALTTKLALDFERIDGPRILRESAEDAFFPVLHEYIKANGVEGDEARLEVGKEFFALMGLGKLQVTGNEKGGQVTLERSHADQAWLKKFGPSDQAVGHVNCGFAAAMFRAAFDKPARTYQTKETTSIVTGEPQGVIQVELS
jgi:hypothetical protein